MISKIERFIFFWLIFFLPSQLNKFFWPDFSYIYSLKIDYLAPSINFWDLLLYCLVLVWLSNNPRFNLRSLTILLFFLLSVLPSLFFAQNLGAGLVRLMQFFNASLFAFYLSSQEITKIRSLYLPLVLSVLFFSTIAVGQFFLGKTLGLWYLGERTFSLSTPSIATFNYYGQIFLRPYSTFAHPNVLAGFLVILLPLIVFLNPGKNYLLLPALIIAALTVFLTFSRAAIIVLAFETVFYFKRKIKILILLVLLTAPYLFVRFNSAFNFDYLSLLRREELAHIAIKFFLEKPVFGIGLNNFLNNSSSSEFISGTVRFLQPVHNIFLLSLAETGIFGFLGLAIIVSYPIVRIISKRKQPIFIMLLFCWIAILLLSNLDHYFLTLPQGQRVLFLVFGISMLEYSSGSDKKNS